MNEARTELVGPDLSGSFPPKGLQSGYAVALLTPRPVIFAVRIERENGETFEVKARGGAAGVSFVPPVEMGPLDKVTALYRYQYG